MSHFQQVVDHVMSNDESQLGKTRAELAFALHCLEREIAICAKVDARNDILVEALQFYARGCWDYGGSVARDALASVGTAVALRENKICRNISILLR